MAETTAPPLDLTPLREKGVQVIRGFFSPEVRADLVARAQEIMALREAGQLTTFDQDSRGLPGSWFVPIVENKDILNIATTVYGPDICSIGFRVLAKGKHFKNAIAIHQDWPYNPRRYAQADHVRAADPRQQGQRRPVLP